MLLLILFCSIQLQSFILSFKGTIISQLVNDSTATKISEDLLEVDMSGEDRIRDDIEHLDCAQFLESEIIVQSRMSSASFKVRVDPRTSIERRVSFVNSLKSMHGCTGVTEFIGVVRDDTRSHLRSYIPIYEYPVLGNDYTIIMCAQFKSEVIPWHIRENWARQIIKATSEIRSKGFLVGGVRWLPEFRIRADGTVVLTRLRTSQRHFENVRGHMAPELRDASDVMPPKPTLTPKRKW